MCPAGHDDFGLDSKNVVLHNRNKYIYYIIAEIIAEYALGQEAFLLRMQRPSERGGNSRK